MTTVDNPKVSPLLGKDEDPKEKGFLNRSRAGGKSFWDWMQLLIIPFVLIIVGSFFSYQQAQTSLQVSQQQHDADQRQALDQQRAAILQTYMDNIQDLLLNHNLLKSKPNDDIVILARARTLSTLRGLDPKRKEALLQFLYEAQLINDWDTIISLNAADLTRADLTGASLTSANLSNVDLSGALLNQTSLVNTNLTGADLTSVHSEIYALLSNAKLFRANLSNANLSGADLSGALLNEAILRDTNLTGADLRNANLTSAGLFNTNLTGADLRNAILSDTDLTGADLSNTNLTGATVTQDQLAKAKSLQGTIMPNGSKHP